MFKIRVQKKLIFASQKNFIDANCNKRNGPYRTVIIQKTH
jgi:hypothetical protein